MTTQLPPDLNDYTLRRKKRGKYKSGPYADLNLPPPNKPGTGFDFRLPDHQKDSPPEDLPTKSTFYALVSQDWLCEACGVRLRFSNVSDGDAPIASFKHNSDGDIKGYCEECFKNV